MAIQNSDRLLERTDKASKGLSLEEVSRIPLSESFLKDIMACLNDPSASEIKWGLWFALGILDSNPKQDFLQFLVSRTPLFLVNSNEDIRDLALSILIKLRSSYENYKDLIGVCLTDPYPAVRAHALEAFSTFLTKSDLRMIIPFKADKYVAETSMGGPLVYMLRNQALHVAEALSGRTFVKRESVEMLPDGNPVYWWDWAEFLQWWEEKSKAKKWWKW